MNKGGTVERKIFSPLLAIGLVAYMGWKDFFILNFLVVHFVLLRYWGRLRENLCKEA
jgi:hypothetical protein